MRLNERREQECERCGRCPYRDAHHGCLALVVNRIQADSNTRHHANQLNSQPVGCVELAMTHRSASRRVSTTHPDMVGPVKRALAAVCVFPRGDLSVRAIGIFDFRLSRRLEALVFSLPIGHALCPLSRPFLSFLLSRSVWLLLPLVGRTGCGKIVTTVDQSDIRVLGPHDLIRQGLPHSTCGRAAHPWPCPRVRRGSPLTVHMPQPVRTTSGILTPYIFSRLHNKNHCSSITSSRAITQMNPTSSHATATCFMGWHRADGFLSRA